MISLNLYICILDITILLHLKQMYKHEGFYSLHKTNISHDLMHVSGRM